MNFFFCAVFVLLLLLPPTIQAQQNTPSSYWQYEARVTHLVVSDVNYDGIDEFVVVAEDGTVTLLSADGRSQWQHQANREIRAVQAVNVDQSEAKEVIFATQNHLTLLSAEGELRWQIRITPSVTPSQSPTDANTTDLESTTPQSSANPVQIEPFQTSPETPDEILILLASGQLQRFNEAGTLTWSDDLGSELTEDNQPKMITDDVDHDGRSEVVLGKGVGQRGFSQLLYLDNDGVVWERFLEGRAITALTFISFSEGSIPFIAMGNNLGQIRLFNLEREQVWLRTLNKPIMDLTAVPLSSGAYLAAATEVGRIVTYNRVGIRQWVNQLSPDGTQAVTALYPATFPPSPESPIVPSMVAIFQSEEELADVVLMSSRNGVVLKTLMTVDHLTHSRLTDINRDGQSELILVGSGGIELLGLGIGSSKNAADWQYNNLGIAPTAHLVLDLDQDGADELLVGGQDGRLHALNNNGNPLWIAPVGGSITQLTSLSIAPNLPADILVLRNLSETDLGGGAQFNSSLERISPTGVQQWRQIIASTATDVVIGDIANNGRPNIIIGTQDGRVLAYDQTGQIEWEIDLETTVQQLVLLPSNETHDTELFAVTETQLARIQYLDESTIIHNPIATFDHSIYQVYTLAQSGGELATTFLILLEDGRIYGHNWRGIQLPPWPIEIGGKPIASLSTRSIVEEAFFRDQELDVTESLLIGTDKGQLLQLNIRDNLHSISWRLSEMGNITALYWGDQDGDTLPDMSIGNEEGKIQLISRNLDPIGKEINLFVPIFALGILNANQQSDFVAITQNGTVQLFRGQDDLPPLLTNPSAEASTNQYSLNVLVQNVDDDPVMVQPEFWNPATNSWELTGEAQTAEREETLLWTAVTIPAELNPVNYRFRYSDGTHEGYITPLPGPPPIILSNQVNYQNLYVLLVVGVFTGVLMLVRQSQTSASRAKRTYQNIQQQPTQTLNIIANRYVYVDGSPDFLLSLASHARQANDQSISGLIDGIYLLTEQPDAGLSIILDTFVEHENKVPQWEGFTKWQRIYETAQLLLTAPSIAELSLLHPKLKDLLDYLEIENHWAPVLSSLMPIATNLRDSERITSTDDRLIYLNEAEALLHQLQRHLPEFSTRIEKRLVQLIMSHWLGSVSAEIEGLRGRAELTVTLKTKRLVPERTEIVLQIANNGRAPAENIIAILDENPAFQSYSDPQILPILPPKHRREISFTIEPKVTERFRIGLSLTYDDRNQEDKLFAFGDMVQLLDLQREFKPIHNPYLPGTPLRRNSPIFVGREHLFNFIEENIGSVAQRNILILIGQRRTGKTSVLLRLDQRLPDQLLPIYIDCQSLGVTPGMPALLHDIAWLISDTFANRGLELDVPEPPEWQDNPTGLFQRQFLPKAQQLLPADTKMMLVFDEFEAFEQLVNDQILPPTLFPYLRHLMQHSEQLSFVFVGTRRLEEMSAGYWSVLFNIALYHKIGYLSESSALKLITEPVAPNLIYDDLALDKILRVTAGHPYFLQLVCYTLIKQANNNHTSYVTISDVNKTLDEMLRLGEMHFAYLWQRSSYIERVLLTAVSHLLDPDRPFHPNDAILELTPYNIHLSLSEATLALNQLVERDIMQEINEQGVIQYQLKIGLVGLWVKKNKSLSKLQTGNDIPSHK